MAKYKVGDKVRIVSKMPDGYACSGDVCEFLGKTGTVKRVSDYLVTTYQFEEIYTDYHGFKYYPAFSEEWIAGLAEPQVKRHDNDLSVVIRFCGNKTTARLMRGNTIVKTATARRNPADKYSRAEGARVAVERLFEKTSGKAKDASKPKIGDKFVVVGRSADVFHGFDIDTIVTLIRLECNGCNQYRDDFGLCQYVSDRDVKPYKENT
nr:MAG TPA: Nitrile hydratase alpha subunit [Bacteriophage sp.]